jgi:AcrR family transcriptional regulator
MTTNQIKKPSKKAQPADSDAQRIVESARAHFFSHGFRSVTMDEPAEELAISKKTLYAHFPSKIALLEAVLADKFAGAKRSRKSRGHTRTISQRCCRTARQRNSMDEIKPPFVRDMRQKAPQVFKIVERRRAELIQRFFGKLFIEGQRTGMVRKDLPAKLMIEILLAAVQAIVNPAKVEELRLTPKTGFASVVKVVLEGVITRKGRKT